MLASRQQMKDKDNLEKIFSSGVFLSRALFTTHAMTLLIFTNANLENNPGAKIASPQING